MPTSAEDRSWTSYLTVDLLWKILEKSIFHPFVAWLIPYSLRAAGYASTHSHVVYAQYWAYLITVVALYNLIDSSIAYGQPRDMDWQEEVVLITGGYSGLGRVLVETYAMRGNSVAVLDVRVPTEQQIKGTEALDRENVRWYKCDVSDLKAVQAVKEAVEKDFGPVTVLINNAGVMYGLPLLSLTAEQVSTTLRVNLLGHFNTIQTFLPSMLKYKNGGTIVTVASVLGKLGSAQLTDYTASKAGLIALHQSLTGEKRTTYAKTGGSNIRTVLVTPGQVNTDLFQGLETPSSFFGPVVEPVELAKEIVRVVDTGLDSEISMPLYAQQIAWLDILPQGLRGIVRWLSGIDYAVAKMQARRAEGDATSKKSN